MAIRQDKRRKSDSEAKKERKPRTVTAMRPSLKFPGSGESVVVRYVASVDCKANCGSKDFLILEVERARPLRRGKEWSRSLSCSEDDRADTWRVGFVAHGALGRGRNGLCWRRMWYKCFGGGGDGEK